jgi:hypothetical protein
MKSIASSTIVAALRKLETLQALVRTATQASGVRWVILFGVPKT